MAQKRLSDLSLRSDFDDTVNLAGEDAAQTWRVTGAQIKSYIQAQIADLLRGSADIQNLGLVASVAGNALTVALKTYAAAADPSSTSPVKIGFRGTTAGTGDFSLISATAATSLVVSSGSTLGTISGVQTNLYVYAINNGGTIVLGISKFRFDDGELVSTTAEGGAGAADSATVMYSTSAVSSKACRLIGRLVVNEATAGTWASAPSVVSVAPFRAPVVPTVQRFTSGSGNYTVPTPAPAWLRVRMIGGGGGGGNSGTTNGTAATDGGDTTFGSSFLTAKGGTKGARDAVGGAGGVAGTVNSPAVTSLNIPGGSGGGAADQATTPLTAAAGGHGGDGYFGGGGGGGTEGTMAGLAGATNSGGGGGGAMANRTTNSVSGSGGGAGNYVEAIIPNPVAAATYAYAVGTGGTGQTAGTSGAAGGAGGSGVVIVEEYYS